MKCPQGYIYMSTLRLTLKKQKAAPKLRLKKTPAPAAAGVGFLTEAQFLEHFKPVPQVTRGQLASRLTVMYSIPQTLEQLFNLVPPTAKRTPIIKDATTDKRYLNREQYLDYLYDVLIVNRFKYLALFYQAYFQFKDPRDLKWTDPSLELSKPELAHPVISVQKNDASRRLIRNLFYLELLDLTKVTNTVKSKVSFWQSLVNLFNKLELEDRFFAPSSVMLCLRNKNTKREQVSGVRETNYNNLFYQFQAYQPKASIFNPYAIKWTLEHVLGKELGRSPAKIFTPVLSWCSYLVAFMHIPSYQHYVGVDVMPTACAKARYLADYYHTLDQQQFGSKQVDILCRPSETLSQHSNFLTRYHQYFDTMIVCPPYYDMEIYHEGEQSIATYPDYQQWLKGYWEPTVSVCQQVAQPGAILAVIANDYTTLDTKHTYALTTDLDQLTRQYFEPIGVYYLQNRTSPLRAAGKDRTERLFLYRKS